MAESDEKLAALAQSGDGGAMEELCMRYKNPVCMLARPYFLAGGDRDDIIQEGMIGLYKAIRDYRPGHSASFSSFAELCVTRQIISAINASLRQKHRPLNSYVSLFNTVGENDRELIDTLELTGGSPEDAFITKETARDVRRSIARRLTPLERRVTELFLKGMSYRDIAGALRCGKKSVDNALYRVRKKLAEDLKEN